MGEPSGLFTKTALRELVRRVANRTAEVHGAYYFFGMLHSKQDVSTEYSRALFAWRVFNGIFLTKRLPEDLIGRLRYQFEKIGLNLRDDSNLYMVDAAALNMLLATGQPPISPARWWRNVRAEVAEVDGSGWLLWKLDPALEQILRQAELIERRLRYRDVPEPVKQTIRRQVAVRQTTYAHPVYKINLQVARRLERGEKVPGTK